MFRYDELNFLFGLKTLFTTSQKNEKKQKIRFDVVFVLIKFGIEVIKFKRITTKKKKRRSPTVVEVYIKKNYTKQKYSKTIIRKKEQSNQNIKKISLDLSCTYV